MIYFIENTERGFVKIGSSYDPEKRLAALRTASPDPLRLVATFPGGAKEERELHARFSGSRLRGEWFLLSDEIREFLDAHGVSDQCAADAVHGLRWVMTTGPGPEWARLAAMDSDGVVFAPAAIAGDETAVTYFAAFDGITLVMDDGHPYLPTDWLARHAPDVADICAMIAEKVRHHIATNP